MSPAPLQVDYTKLPPAQPPRTLATWVLLVAIWLLGLLVWCFYIAGFGYLLIRFLSR